MNGERRVKMRRDSRAMHFNRWAKGVSQGTREEDLGQVCGESAGLRRTTGSTERLMINFVVASK